MFLFQLPLLSRSTRSLTRARPIPPCITPHTGFGSGGQTEELGQDESATSSFLVALNAAGISVPQGVVISDRIARESSSGSGQSAVSRAGTP